MESNYPFVSIIIPVRNVEKFIGRCLDSLKDLNYPQDKYEVIISDSDSTDETRPIVQKYKTVFVSTPQRSICAGRNKGFSVAKGEIIAFSDADCVMDKDWIKNSLKYFENPMIGGVGGPNITPPEEKPFAKAVGFVLNQAIFSAGSIYGRILKDKKEVKSIPGCNAIYRKRVLDKIMPLDETLLAEDYVMNQKIRQLGYKIIYTPDTIIWHYRRSTPKKFFKQMHHYAVCRLSAGKKSLKMINLFHVVAGLGLPILIGLFVVLICINPLWFMFFVSFLSLFLLVYFFLALIKFKSFKTSIFVPYAIIILSLSWSAGFLKELFFPFKKNKINS